MKYIILIYIIIGLLIARLAMSTHPNMFIKYPKLNIAWLTIIWPYIFFNWIRLMIKER